MKKFISTKSAFAAGLVVAAFALAATVSAATFSTNLKLGSTGADVKNLQMILNMSPDTQVSTSGAGAPGMETTYFGSKTKAAVIKFQNKYASDILAPVGLTSGTGFVGMSTRAKLNTMDSTVATTPVTTTTTTVPGCTAGAAFSSTTGQACGATTVVTPAGTGLSVSSATQPSNGLAIQGASRVPFTKVTLTAGSSDVVVNGITVERTGAAVDGNFSGIVLLDEDGTQFDIAKTLGSTHQAIIGGTFTVKAGTTKTLTVAGNMAASLAANAGQVASLSVVAVNTTATVTGSLPVVGAYHTINGTLTIGSVSTSTSAYDPGTTASKAIGTTGYKFTGVRVTAGTGEDVRLKSVRFYQAGSASASDISNVKIYVDGTAYDTTVSDRYYTANFGSGIVIAKGLAKDVWIAGDITGTNSSSRTIDFDIKKNTDIYFTGETYGQGIMVTNYDPAVNGYAVTVTAGSMTSVTKATSVPAQNIAINLANQVLGGYETDLTGEPISVQSHVFTVATGTAASGLLTSISLYNENGAVVAGPVDATWTIANLPAQTITFTDTVTYPTGKHTYTLKGKVPATAVNGAVLTVTTVPSSGWTSVTGQTTGNTITLTNGSISLNAVTVKAASLAVAQSTSPAAQTIVSGGVTTFANIQLDASASGEDVRLSSIALTDTVVGGAVTNLTTCQIFDGATALNTGSNVVNPSAAAATFTFDSTLTIAKNTVKTLTLKCNVATGLTTGWSYTWNMTTAQIAALSITGVTSGATVTASGTTTTGPTQTIGAGALAISLDSSSPAYAIATAGTTGVTLGAYKFTASNDAVDLTRVGLSLGAITASSSAADLTQVTLWNGATQVGTAQFVGTSRYATSTLSTPVHIAKDGYAVITVKGDLANQGASEASHPGALLTVNVDILGAAGSLNTSATGVGTGVVIDPTGSTSVAGVRVFKSAPIVATRQTPSSAQAYGLSSTLIAQAGIDIYRFSIAASAKGDIALSQLTINVATSTVSTTNGTTTVNNLKVYAYTGSDFSTGAVAGYTAGQVVATITNLANGNNTATISPVLTIPAGQTYYFKVVGDVAQVAGTTGSVGSVTTKLSGDTAYPIHSALMATSTGAISGFGNAGLFIWSPMSTSSTASNNNVDWTNSFNVPGISSGSTDSFTLSK